MTREEILAELENAKLHAAFERDVEILDACISALQNQPRWISVDERFPEYETVALVWDGDFRKVGRFSRKYGWHTEYKPHDENGGAFLYNVTHWMPLPSAPEEEV